MNQHIIVLNDNSVTCATDSLQKKVKQVVALQAVRHQPTAKRRKRSTRLLRAARRAVG